MRGRDKVLLGALAGAGAIWGTRAYLRYRRRIGLADRVVIITGASSGHGLLVAREAAEKGAHLVLAARKAEDLKQAEAELLRLGARSVLSVPTDVTKPDEAKNLIDRAIERHGRIDILINNAGIITVGPVESMTLDDFHQAMATNFWGVVHTTMAVLPQMKAQQFGRIGNVVSVGGLRAVPHMLPYTASKFALSGFTDGLRSELARDNILVTGIYPSTMRTGGHTHAWFKGKQEDEFTWFALGDSLPLLSTSAEQVAHRLWQAVCDGEPSVVVGWPARALVLLQNLLPNEIAEVIALADRYVLPASENLDAPAKQGQDLEGTVPNLLNRAVPAKARPGTA
ncbi:SDR family NAD(P)-dependent oxidoreductase [Singulisphaera sp. PoT]|uniref:SDR family NAD(P)-dependent oxidoreductase n=1 Tax=Singulisphaera sp. PoT TaxID=3411797 RepID=UPI003BF46831